MSKTNGNGNRFNQRDFNEYILGKNIILIGDTILSSGRNSPYYINWRRTVGEGHSGNVLSKYVFSFVRDKGLEPRTFLGVKDSMSAFGAYLTYQWAEMQTDYGKHAYPVVFERAVPKKGHGDPDDMDYVGGRPRGKIIVIEDMSTSGDSGMKTVQKARENGADVIALISLTNRNEKSKDGSSIEDFYKKNKVQYYAMSNAVDLLPEVYKNRQDGRLFKDKLESYFKENGTRELDLNKIPHM